MKLSTWQALNFVPSGEFSSESQESDIWFQEFGYDLKLRAQRNNSDFRNFLRFELFSGNIKADRMDHIMIHILKLDKCCMYLIAKVDESGTRLHFRIYVSRESTCEPPKSQSKPKIYQMISEKKNIRSLDDILDFLRNISYWRCYYNVSEHVEPSW